MIRSAIVTTLLALTGCATCERYPVACAGVGVMVAGSIAATIAANDRQHHRAAPVAVCPPHGDVLLHPGVCT